MSRQAEAAYGRDRYYAQYSQQVQYEERPRQPPQPSKKAQEGMARGQMAYEASHNAGSTKKSAYSEQIAAAASAKILDENDPQNALNAKKQALKDCGYQVITDVAKGVDLWIDKKGVEHRIDGPAILPMEAQQKFAELQPKHAKHEYELKIKALGETGLRILKEDGVAFWNDPKTKEKHFVGVSPMPKEARQNYFRLWRENPYGGESKASEKDPAISKDAAAKVGFKAGEGAKGLDALENTILEMISGLATGEMMLTTQQMIDITTTLQAVKKTLMEMKNGEAPAAPDAADKPNKMAGDVPSLKGTAKGPQATL